MSVNSSTWPKLQKGPQRDTSFIFIFKKINITYLKSVLIVNGPRPHVNVSVVRGGRYGQRDTCQCHHSMPHMPMSVVVVAAACPTSMPLVGGGGCGRLESHVDAAVGVCGRRVPHVDAATGSMA